MAQSLVIHARIDAATKDATERVLNALGITPTEAIRLLYRQIALRGEFPLELKVPNAATRQALSEAERGVNVETFSSTDDLYASWNS